MSKWPLSKTPWERCVYPVLKEELEKTDYNQIALAQSLGVTQTTVISWTHGDRDTTIQMLLRLEALTGMSFDELFGKCEGRR